MVWSLWLVVALAGLAQAQTTTWAPIDLGTLGGTSVDTSTANGINNRGDVVGSSTIYGQTHAFLWTAADGMRDLGTLGGASSTARSINEARHVVGASDLGPDVRHAFVWTDAGGMVDLGTLGGATSEAFAINNLGQVVGTSLVATGERHPFLWTEATGMTDLASALGDTAAPGDQRRRTDRRQQQGILLDPFGWPRSASKGDHRLGREQCRGSDRLLFASGVPVPMGVHLDRRRRHTQF